MEPAMIDLADQRQRMVRTQIRDRGVTDPRVLAAMGQVRREAFVPAKINEFAYEDSPLPIAEGQSISQPYIVALMAEAAQVKPGDHVLEIGAGSGYAAAVLAQIADHVWTIERHGALAEAARRTLAEQGCENVEVRHGDGTRGWPEAAPFDAILVAAGGPAAPEALKAQLKIGGRLIVPVGDSQKHQTLMRLTRTAPDAWREEELGAVVFVPLIGDCAWPEQGGGLSAAVSSLKHAFAPRKKGVAAHIAEAAEPLPDFDDPAFGAMFDRFAGARVVLLGEATHGTSEFYRARTAITRRLIEQHGFDVVAIEADWPDAAAVDRYVRDKPGRPRGDKAFKRFPLWMWRNHETHDFIEWLRGHNLAQAEPSKRAAFYGLDIYSLGASINEVVGYLDRVDPEAAAAARERYGCLTPWQKDPAVYGRAALTEGFSRCEKPVGRMLRELLEKRLDYAAQDGEDFFDAAQNARLVQAAERYYRVMYYGSRDSWNLRDTHMFETLERVLEARGPHSKAIVWAHNSHVGDASATEMGSLRGELNIGELCRRRFAGEAALIGFGTDRGTVAAASDWGGEMQIKTVRPSNEESYERLCRDSHVPRFLLDLAADAHPDLHAELTDPRLERAIGVIYRPDSERLSHYFEASLAEQFDAYVWFDETHAVAPLPGAPPQGAPDTYPFGV
jgi:protein-L-isoaspartate(D-aspartate) O-methyltransferase